MTIALVCYADWSKLKTMIILKRKTMPKVKFLYCVFIFVNEIGWMNVETMIKLTDEVWKKQKR